MKKFDEAFTRHQAGDIGAAAPLYRVVLEEEPDHPDALHMLGVIAQQTKNPELALQLMDMALAKRPDMPMAWLNRCLVLRVLKRPAEAMKSAQRALDADPHFADAHDMMGSLLRETGKFDEARAHHEQAIKLQPNNANYHNNFAFMFFTLEDLPNAYKEALTAVRLDQNLAPLTLGNILQAAGYPERAIPYYEKATKLLPQSEAAINEAVARLQIGDFERGWELWEKRRDNNPLFQSIPRWNGESIEHLFLYEDQGMGDAIQCVRYLQLVKERAMKIALQIAKPLQKLFTENFPDISVLALDEPPPKADARARLMSLPYLFKTRLDNIPANTPYLHADEKSRAFWRDKLSALPKPRIGLVWGGNPDNRNDQNRSASFAQFANLVGNNGKHFISLQKGIQKNAVKLTAAGIFDADPYLDDFTSTAGLISELDLLISVDTAPVHLAGAMGKPAWLLLPFEPEWRWMHGREDSLWYPTLRIFRQTAPRDWSSAITKAASELQKFIAGDKNVLSPRPWKGLPLRQNPYAINLGEDL